MNNEHNFKIAALLYRRGKLIRIGINGSKKSPKFYRKYPNGEAYCAHAEMDALQMAQPGDRLVVIRWRRKDGKPTMAKPCIHCQKHISRKRITSVKYTDRNGNWQLMG